ncbi:hypothetical protein N825_20055 [Skermanella stibiiresistens SB22]|uniref:YjiS-like domain-containing protein n=1 Tax=Skermanella stibiiresistens SB22 TaxID=1385369 RepID=W9H8J4_9PROT|nr:DUF1127 domain-containing protein [Skermanella stibiiresistens]EWY42359.1 hypothetical protein N825_20055 [Skermanella stibiiresistens SB22]
MTTYDFLMPAGRTSLLDMLRGLFTRAPHDDGSEASGYDKAERELNAMTDRELRDLGLSRGDIHHAVRFGR